jgi:hypothetical protein
VLANLWFLDPFKVELSAHLAGWMTEVYRKRRNGVHESNIEGGTTQAHTQLTMGESGLLAERNERDRA